MTKAEIIAALPKLDKVDLEVVYAVAGQLLGGYTAVAPQSGGKLAQTIFSALTGTLGLSTPFCSIGASKNHSLFIRRCHKLITFLDKDFVGWDKKQTTQLALLRMLFQLLYDDLKNRSVTPTINIMILNMDRMHEVFDAQFPGYREAGRTNWILNKFK